MDKLKDYLQYIKIEKGLSDNTILSYKYDLTKYLNYLNKDISLATTKDILCFLDSLKASSKSSRTISRYITSIKNFHLFLVKEKYLNKNVSKYLGQPKIKKTLPQYLDSLEIDKLFDIDLITVFDYRNKAMLELMYGSGLRISELINLNFNSIDFTNCHLKCNGKGNKERIIPIGEYIITSLNAYLSKRAELVKSSPSDYLFLNNHGKKITRQGFFKVLKKLLKEKGLNQNITPHTLRHSFATHMILNGADLKTVQLLLGHADLKTTRIYTHITNAKIKNDYNSSHPRKDL